MDLPIPLDAPLDPYGCACATLRGISPFVSVALIALSMLLTLAYFAIIRKRIEAWAYANTVEFLTVVAASLMVLNSIAFIAISFATPDFVEMIYGVNTNCICNP